MNILIIAFSDIKKDARVSRQINWLLPNHSLSLIAYDCYQIDGLSFLKISNHYPIIMKIIGAILLKLKLFEVYYYTLTEIKKSENYLKSLKFDLIIANDIQSLPLAVKYKNSAYIYFDAHEYSPKEHDTNSFWCFFFRDYYSFLCNKFIPKCDFMTTVSFNIKKEYEKIFKKEVYLLLNLPDNNELFYDTYQTNCLQNHENKNQQSFKFVHHGVALPQRKMELMIEVFKKLGSNYILDLYLVPTNQNYYNKLKKDIEFVNNISIKNPIEINQIIPTIFSYDAGIFLLPSNSFNYIYTLPNKLFDFIQARLAVIIGPSPEMRRIVEQYECGIATKSFDVDEIVNEIKSISKEDIIRFKKNADLAARELNSDKSREVFMKIINEVETQREKI